MNNRWPFTSPGIPDEYFQRLAGVPMTKQEVRAVSISLLRIFSGAIMYDLGAGTGSVGVECALLGCGKVFAVERKPEAVALVKQNIEYFQLDNIEPVTGKAPEALDGLPAADRIFLGGSGGCLADILQATNIKLKDGGRLVVTSVTVDTGPQVIKFLENNNFTDINITGLSVSRAVSRGSVHLWNALNPVQIISGQKGEI
ncbi:MAG: precorrin-6Y C5,15-methyltransferase (decarboxylating) subunit CbiT [Firmicutes bacterium]|nr:precorrin-6Y C5,15-methyltransferase (decarboxylating) subunit CbiT [Bacillota bacterium]